MQPLKKTHSLLSTSEKIQQVITLLEEKKGKDITNIDLAGKSSFTEAVIVVTATSNRHAQALADHILDLCKKQNFDFFHTEGFQEAQWILLDCNDFIVNIFQENTRALYNLEKLWADIHSLRSQPTLVE